MRPVDTAARLGGDEFAILIHGPENEMQASRDRGARDGRPGGADLRSRIAT